MSSKPIVLIRTLAALAAAAGLAACATPSGGQDHAGHHPDRSATTMGAGSSGTVPAQGGMMGGMMGGGMAGSQAAGAGGMQQMNKEEMCAMYRNMRDAPNEQARQAMMDRHMQAMSPAMRQQHMEMMRQQCQ